MIKKYLEKLGLDGSRAGLMLDYLDAVLEKNKVMNLTAISDREQAALLHIADSLTLFEAARFPQGSSFADVGSGAGFPAAVIAIARPDMRVVAIDGTEKRMKFVADTARALGIANLTARKGRAEELARESCLRDSFDFAAARAVAAAPVLLEYCLPLVKPGGRFFAMKSAEAEDEIAGALSAAAALSARLEKIVRMELPGGQVRRAVAVFEKTGATDAKYPRAGGRIKKAPL